MQKKLKQSGIDLTSKIFMWINDESNNPIITAEEIDLKNPKTNRKNAGFTDEERAKFRELKAAGFVDTFRHLHPEEVKYSWWSYMFKAREKNAGWRIDYFVVSEDLKDSLVDAKIHTQVLGSDHCPVELDIF